MKKAFVCGCLILWLGMVLFMGGLGLLKSFFLDISPFNLNLKIEFLRFLSGTALLACGSAFSINGIKKIARS